MFRKILLPVDFSAHSQKVIECLEEFKGLDTEEIVLLHVIDREEAVVGRHVELSRLDRHKAVAREELAKIAGELAQHGFASREKIEIGSPAVEITKTAENENVSLIIMGSHGKSAVKELLLGSVTENVIRMSSRPVLIEKFNVLETVDPAQCKRICEKTFKKILFPTDFSDCANEALKVIGHLKEAGTEEVLLLHVQDERKIKPHLMERLEEFNKIDEERLYRLKLDLERFDLRVTTQIEWGTPFVKILEASEKEKVSSIAIASHGRSLMHEMFLGSTSEKIARKAKMPVLLIHSAGKEGIKYG